MAKLPENRRREDAGVESSFSLFNSLSINNHRILKGKDWLIFGLIMMVDLRPSVHPCSTALWDWRHIL